MDERNYVGVSIHKVPQAWVSNRDAIRPLYFSVELARDAIKFGVYEDKSMLFAKYIITSGPRTQTTLQMIQPNRYGSWRRTMRERRVQGRGRGAEDEP